MEDTASAARGYVTLFADVSGSLAWLRRLADDVRLRRIRLGRQWLVFGPHFALRVVRRLEERSFDWRSLVALPRQFARINRLAPARSLRSRLEVPSEGLKFVVCAWVRVGDDTTDTSTKKRRATISLG